MAFAVLPARWRRLPSLLAAVALASASALPGEDPLPKFHEETEVSLVQVPVVVTARDGQPVRGLTAADFDLFDDGARQRIEAVDVVDRARLREAGEEPWQLPPVARRRYLLLFDLTYSGPASTRRAQEAASRFVGNAMAPDELAGVATVSVELGARLLLPFTSDRRQLLAAIGAVGMPSGTDAARDPLGFSLPSAPDSANGPPASAAGDSPRSDPSAAIDDAPRLQLETSTQTNVDGLATSRVDRHLKALGGLAKTLSVVNGEKIVVFFSEGFDQRLLAGNAAESTSAADNDALTRGQFWALNVDRRFASGPLLQGVTDTLDELHRSECVVYPVDIAGVRLDDSGHLESAHRGREALTAIAAGSGGQVIHAGDVLNEAVEGIRQHASLIYVLSFRPSRKADAGRYHKLKVKVARSGARIEARAGYYEARSFIGLSALQRSLSAADVITHEREASAFPMLLLALALDSGPSSRVPVLLEIPGSELLAKAPAGPMRLTLYVYAVSESGEVADSFVRTLRLDPAGDAARLNAGPLRYGGQLRLAAGRYRVRALARDEEQGRSAFRAVSIDVPGPEAAGVLRASVPLFLSGPGGGITLRDTGRVPASADPFEIAGEKFLPYLAPALTASQSSRVCILLSTGGAEPQLQIQGRILREGGGDWAPGRLEVLGRTSPDADGVWKILLAFEPPALPSGAYRLAITLRRPAEPAVPVVREAAFRIP